MLRRPLLASLVGPLSGCALVGGPDAIVPDRLPDGDWALGASAGVVWDEARAIDLGDPLVGVDASWLDGVWGLHAGLRVHGEGRETRLGGLLEATGWYGVMLGVGTRVGWTLRGAHPAVELTALLALPIPVWRCATGGGSVYVAPYARPGFRLGRDHDLEGDAVRGFHEVGLTVRWTSF